jgi:hypothetical protein
MVLEVYCAVFIPRTGVSQTILIKHAELGKFFIKRCNVSENNAVSTHTRNELKGTILPNVNLSNL